MLHLGSTGVVWAVGFGLRPVATAVGLVADVVAQQGVCCYGGVRLGGAAAVSEAGLSVLVKEVVVVPVFNEAIYSARAC